MNDEKPSVAMTEVGTEKHTEPSRLWSEEWAERVYRLEEELGRAICGAHTRSTDHGGPCRLTPEPGRNRCKFHGGRMPMGVESHNYKGRGYSKHLPTRLRDKLEHTLMDPDLTSLRQEIALLVTRVKDLGESLSEASAQEAVEEATGALALALPALEELEEEPLPEQPAQALLEAKAHVRTASQALATLGHEAETWEEIYKVTDLLRKTAESERKREDRLAETMTASQAATLYSALNTAIHDVLGEYPDLKEKLARRVESVMNYDGRTRW